MSSDARSAASRSSVRAAAALAAAALCAGACAGQAPPPGTPAACATGPGEAGEAQALELLGGRSALPQGNVDRGARHFAEQCARCHAPEMAAAKRYPRLDCAPALDASSDEYLFAVVAYGGRPFGKRGLMRGYLDEVGEQGVADLVAYLRSAAR